MKQRILGALVLAVATAGVYFLSSPLGSLPAIGKLLSPTEGLWRNAETGDPVRFTETAAAGLQSPVRIQYDERLVPHIFAENDHDAYYAQGYVTAALRLFQLDFQTRAAAGRISEVLGARAIDFDRNARRIGLGFGAENALKAMEKDPETKAAVEAYTAGINAYIATLSPAEYPVEYKLLGFAPEAWTPLRSALLLKQMSLTLSFEGSDFDMSQVLSVLGRETTEFLFPNFGGPYQVPIIPKGTRREYGTATLPVAEVPDSLDLPAAQAANTSGGWQPPRTPKDVGSNNWVISGDRSATGFPILANDPHLSLSLPSIWLEMHLVTPSMNVYGVSLPGAPGIIIGFTANVAWGMTNVGADVVDYYQIEFTDPNFETYRYDGAERQTSVRIETIQVKGGEDVIDTIRFTHHGPLPFLADAKHPQRFQALRWLAHEPSNELRTFLELNRAKNYQDYERALQHFRCPAQNFIFADNQQNIALWVNGDFPLKEAGQGKYVSAGNTPKTEWQGFIPRNQNPHARNPASGMLASANQQSAAADYPFYIDWDQESWERGARIYDQLAKMRKATPDSLRALQNDNLGLLAQKLLPVLLDSIANQSLTGEANQLRDTLRAWDYRYEAWATAPTLFDTWYTLLFQRIWEDDLDSLLYPDREITTYLLVDSSGVPWLDDRRTPARETLAELALATYQQAVDSLRTKHGPVGPNWRWAAHKNTTIRHLLRLPGFARTGLPIGGGKGIVNATSSTFGPSWRVVVAVGPKGPEAYGIYPGGQSGNPGSRYYDSFVDTWAKGELAPLRFLVAPADTGIVGEQRLVPTAK